MSREDWNRIAPGWDGETRTPEFLMADGSIRSGTFDLEDSWYDGEETTPIWWVIFADGQRLSFYDDSIKGWRDRTSSERPDV